MTTIRNVAITLTTILACAVLATTAQADITGSKHDFTTGGLGQGAPSSSNEICVFCHTPHGSDQNVSAPLWNKVLPTTTYQRYSSLGTATLDGTEVAVGSVSLACLSCHDGTQAMDVVLNAPGSGGYNAAGAEIDVGAPIGFMAGAVIPVLGSDLRDDHPVSIAYAGGACTGTSADCTPTAATGDPDFLPAQFALVNGGSAWWVDSAAGTANQRDKTDMILYTRDFGGTPGPAVECGSCHDPHEKAARPVSFLRVDNSGSAVCLSCHIK